MDLGTKFFVPDNYVSGWIRIGFGSFNMWIVDPATSAAECKRLAPYRKLEIKIGSAYYR